MIAGATSNELSPVVAAIVGFGVATVGALLVVASGPLRTGLNKLYGSLPGRFQYPRWFVPLCGAFLVIFGLLVAGIGLAASVG